LTASTNREQWIEECKREQREVESKNCTFKPVTNVYNPNNVGRSETESEVSRQEAATSGDKCLDLYQMSYQQKK
jgi:hypothetical protein